MPFDPSAIAGLLFDLDGTLIDSSADLVASGNWLRQHEGLSLLDPARITGYVGDGAEALVRRLLERPQGGVSEALQGFMLHYHEHCLDQTRLYPGVAATLEALQAKGYKMAVVTNKPERISRRILEGLGTGRAWGAVVGGNTCKHKKPHPEPLLKACGDLGVQPHQVAMVGDSRVDVEAGKNAACQTIGLLGGIGDQGLLRAAGPDALLDGFEALLGIL
jgi:phosphoglycolate phosphatase